MRLTNYPAKAVILAERIRSTVCTRMQDARSGCAADCAHLVLESILQPRRFLVLFLIDIPES
jgi:hypothetical protein